MQHKCKKLELLTKFWYEILRRGNQLEHFNGKNKGREKDDVTWINLAHVATSYGLL
jgi:hypothetical protein